MKLFWVRYNGGDVMSIHATNEAAIYANAKKRGYEVTSCRCLYSD